MSTKESVSIKEVLSDDTVYLQCPYCHSCECNITNGANAEKFAAITILVSCTWCQGEWTIVIENYRSGVFLNANVYEDNHLKYKEYIKSPKWKLKAEDAKIRAGFRCQLCNKSDDEITLHAHHRTYERLGKELDEDITVLCSGCHAKFHDKLP